jgi:very-short-patch-repair endonuclease
MITKLNDKQWLHEQYHTHGLSLQNIADDLGTNRQRVRRALIKQGIATRSKSDAQKAALQSGRAIHPTEGTERPEEVRMRIAESVAKDWANADEATLKARSDKAKTQWQNMPQQEREALLKSARDAVRLTAKEGSQVEKFLRDGLTKANYNVQYHVVGLIPNNRLEVDLFLPEISTAIEVDGPSHFLPIWGEDKLQRNIQADLQKTGLLLAQGLVIVRVKQTSSNVSSLLKRKILASVHNAVKQIEQKFPAKNKRLIELEV